MEYFPEENSRVEVDATWVLSFVKKKFEIRSFKPCCCE